MVPVPAMAAMSAVTRVLVVPGLVDVIGVPGVLVVPGVALVRVVLVARHVTAPPCDVTCVTLYPPGVFRAVGA